MRLTASPGGIFLGYILATLLLTYPLAFQLRTSLPSLDSDDLIALWGNWWYRQFLYHGESYYYTHALFYPNGASLAAHSLSPLFSVFSTPFFSLLGEWGSYNLATLAIFVLGGFGMYLLVLELTRRKPAAFVAGLVYAFAPYHLTQALAHPNLGSVQWMPFMALCLVLMFKRRSRKFALLAGLFFALSVWSGLQLGVFAGAWVVVFVGWTLLTERATRNQVNFMNLVAAGFVALILSLPAVLPIVREINTGYALEDLVINEESTGQTDVLAYFVPPRLHPLFGSTTAPLYDKFPKNHQWMPYLGYIALGLAIFGAVRAGRLARFWWVSALLWIVLALGIFPRIYGKTYDWIPLPYSLLSEHFPFNTLRSADRFNLLVPMSLAVLVGFGLAQVRRQWIVAIAAAALMFEYLCVPVPMEPPQPLSRFITRMARDAGSYAVLDLPMGKYVSRFWDYQQTIHSKPVVEGHISRTPADAYDFIDTLPSLAAMQEEKPVKANQINADLCRLNQNGVRYILIHKDYTTLHQVLRLKEYMNAPPYFEDGRLVVYETNRCG